MLKEFKHHNKCVENYQKEEKRKFVKLVYTDKSA